MEREPAVWTEPAVQTLRYATRKELNLTEQAEIVDPRGSYTKPIVQRLDSKKKKNVSHYSCTSYDTRGHRTFRNPPLLATLNST